MIYLHNLPPTVVTLLGFLAGFITTLSALPQTIQTCHTRQTEDISLIATWMLAVALGIWLDYGILLNNVPVIVWNFLGLVTFIPLLFLKEWYEPRKGVWQSVAFAIFVLVLLLCLPRNLYVINFIGYLGGILSTFSTLPQIIKTLRTRSAKDLSVNNLILRALGLGLWVVYGSIIVAGPIILCNVISVALVSWLLTLRLNPSFISRHSS
jgi:MtN3 and saliva related transmembrane protein